MTSKVPVRSVDEIPGPKPSLPFLGTTWVYFPFIGHYDMTGAMHEANRDKYERYGPVCREEFSWGVPFVHLYSPDDIEHVLRHQGRLPSRPVMEAVCQFRLSHPELYNGVGLVNSEGEEWHRIRSNLAAVIQQPRVVQAYLGPQNRISDDLVSLLGKMRSPEDGTLHNLVDPLHRLALESSAMFCLDRRLRCLEVKMDEDGDAKRMIRASIELFESYQQLYYGLPLWKYYRTAAYRKMEQAEFTIYNVISKLLKQVQDSANANSTCSARDPKEEEVPSVVKALQSTEDIRDVQTEVGDFITAGIDTSAISLVFLLHHLASHPEVQDKLYAEILRVAGAHGDVTTAVISQMAYLKACIKESFRLTPVAPNIVRSLPESLVLGGYLLPKGTIVSCETMLAGRNPKHVPCPDDFIPERFMPHPPAHLASSVRVLPFGQGGRMCPGRRFAEQEISVTIIKILQTYEVRTDSKMEVIYCFVMTPKQPVTVRLLPRQPPAGST